MKNLILIVAFLSVVAWAIPKPMESITNYNVMMLHGALGSDKGFKPDESIPEAAYDDYRGSGHIGKYGDHKDRVTYWLSRNVFKEPDWDDIKDAVRASSIYAWRSFTNPANTSLNNAHEMGDRMWNAKIDGYSKFGKRRALFEEAQEVRAFEVVDDGERKKGQSALEIIRKDPDLYRQLASRYILIGYSMGGIVSREYVQGNFYNGDVDKIITLDSLH